MLNSGKEEYLFEVIEKKIGNNPEEKEILDKLRHITQYDKKYLDEILKYTDLVILDIKAINESDYKNMTGKDMSMFEFFKNKVLASSGNPAFS